jgi:hypothetical protein
MVFEVLRLVMLFWGKVRGKGLVLFLWLLAEFCGASPQQLA